MYFPAQETPPVEAVNTDHVVAQIARYTVDTWESIKAMVDERTGLPQDRVTFSKESQPRANAVTSPTNIGLYLSSLIAAKDLDLITEEERNARATEVLIRLTTMNRHKGLYFNWYNTSDGSLTAHNPFISTVDNAWLVTGLITLKSACDAFEPLVNEILSTVEFECLYDPKEHLFYGGYDPVQEKTTPWHYGLLNTEARIASYIGLRRYHLPITHQERLFKDSIVHDPLHKSWGGSMFEVMMPSLFVSEHKNEAWQKVYKHHIEVQMAAGEQNGGFWGFSPCDNPDGIYTEFGVSNLAVKPGGYGSHSVITPHAIFLTLPREPLAALHSLERIEELYPHSYTTGRGFSDSIDIKTGKASPSQLILDQTMSFLSLYNYQTDHRLHSYFEDNESSLYQSLPVS